MAGLSGTPVFDVGAAGGQPSQQQQQEGAGGDGAQGSDGERDGYELPGGDGGSRVRRVKLGGGGKGGLAADDGAGLPRFVALLRACADAGDWSSFIAHLRTLSPAALDREVRALGLLAPDLDHEADDLGGTAAPSASLGAQRDVCSLLEAVDSQLQSGANFEFATALLQLVLAVHGDAVSEQPVLRAAAARVHRRLRPVWGRLEGLLGDVQCMTAFFANLQQA